MKAIRWLLSWAFYWLGDFASMMLPRGDKWGRWGQFLVWVYQRSMNLSDSLQGDGRGPWGDGPWQSKEEA